MNFVDTHGEVRAGHIGEADFENHNSGEHAVADERECRRSGQRRDAVKASGLQVPASNLRAKRLIYYQHHRGHSANMCSLEVPVTRGCT